MMPLSKYGADGSIHSQLVRRLKNATLRTAGLVF